MRTIRRISEERDLMRYAEICVNAYPGFSNTSEQWLQWATRMSSEEPTANLWAVWEEEMMGAMCLYDFEMNYLGEIVAAGGVGAVAVDLLHKKKHAAKDLISFFLDKCEEKDQQVAMLYPFRPDFYYKMGFGYGTKMHQYKFTPRSLPYSGTQDGIVYLGGDDVASVTQCYNSFARRQHGYCLRSEQNFSRMLKPSPTHKVIGYKKDGEVFGYLVISPAKTEQNRLNNNIQIREWVCLTPDALEALCNHLYVQTDQFDRIVVNTQQDGFHHLLKDVRDGSHNLIPSVYHQCNTSGVGLMYRIVSVEKFLKKISFRNFNGMTANVNLTVKDSFRSQNEGTYYLCFTEGNLELKSQPLDGIDVKLDIALLSSLLMGSTDIKSLYRLGLVRIDNTHLLTLQAVFATASKPECITAF